MNYGKWHKTEKQFLIDNPNLCASSAAKILGKSAGAVNAFRFYNGPQDSKWFHKGCGVPLLNISISSSLMHNVYHLGGTIYSSASFDKAIGVVDHLIWCIENGYFNMKRVENPYFSNLRMGEQL